MKATNRSYRVALWLVLALALPAALLLAPTASAFPLKVPTAIPTIQADITIAVQSASATVNAGDAFDVLVTINSDTPSRGAQAEVSFDPKLVQIVSVSEGDYYKKWAQANKGNSIMQPSKPKVDNEKGLVPLVGIAVIGGTLGQGPTGSGTLMVLHAQAQPGVSGPVTFKLDNLIVSDVGDPVSGNTQQLGGVKIQNGVVAVGAGQAVVQPTAVAVTIEPTIELATVEPRSQAAAPADASDSGGPGGLPILLLVAVPVVGAVVIGGGAFVMTRKRK